MKLKIPIPDFSNSEIVGKRTTANKKKVKSTQEDVIVDLFSNLDLNSKNISSIAMMCILVITGLIIFSTDMKSIDIQTNTFMISSSAQSMISFIPLLMIGALGMGLMPLLFKVLRIR